ncbi:MAG: metalloregulator ArsR/SmtB family transcription factor [Nocardioides sp.]
MRIGREPLGRVEAVEVAAMFSALSNPVRVRLFALIACHDGGEACVCDLIEAFEVSPPTISHHLKVLRKAGLITAERRGTWIYYSVDSVKLAELAQVLDGSAVEKPGVG